MFFYLLQALSHLIPGAQRRKRFTEWARSRFSIRAIVDAALADQRKAQEEDRALLARTLHRMQQIEPPSIMGLDETLDALAEGQSIARLGVGELMTMEGRFDEFQVPSSDLSRRLREVLTSDEPGMLVGIPSLAYELNPLLTKTQRRIYFSNGPWIRTLLGHSLRPGKVYAPIEITLTHTLFEGWYDRRDYFEKIRRVWAGTDIVLVHGDGIFDGLTHDIFDNATSVEHLIAPREDAFGEYDDILRRVLETSKDKLIIVILGPTATVLAYDLHRAGYRALDLGHIAKAYDWWLEGRFGDEDDFFSPD
ncbi:SP_1767 family glycosyltransferase [Microbacterium aoyamense]|uniref:SP_1767 family glycosyltransferase n=1 Tax=Microbacterium aoyamense TaxID=344166 RepID=A0ABN2PHV7_9MICO|nr:GT-D fold domain-containing glycosyltransferase [Microbacterium aoyamense]